MRIETSSTYRRWMRNLRDARAKMRINARIAQIQHHGALFGDWKPLDHDLIELRFHFGPGYRIYASLQGSDCGGRRQGKPSAGHRPSSNDP